MTAGTVLHGSKLPLTVWFWAAYLMATHSNGISALQLQKQLGLGSYKTAWLLCAKLRRAMVAPGRSPLAGLVEVDETEIPCRSEDDPLTGGGGRSHQGKMPVAGAVEVQDGGPGRIRLIAIKDYAAKTLHAVIRDNHRPRRHRQDRWLGRLPRRCRASTTSPTSSARWPPTSSCPGPIACSRTSRPGRSGVYHGLRRKHLQAYLDEFVFRFNRRRTRHAAFRSLLGIGLQLTPATYQMLIAPEATA